VTQCSVRKYRRRCVFGGQHADRAGQLVDIDLNAAKASGRMIYECDRPVHNRPDRGTPCRGPGASFGWCVILGAQRQTHVASGPTMLSFQRLRRHDNAAAMTDAYAEATKAVRYANV
jgi:hypothetical protein